MAALRKTPRQTKPATAGDLQAPVSLPPVSSPSRLLTYTELPLWMQDNAYILTAYRPPSNNLSVSLLSILRLHNESVNIWTHLAGFLCAVTGGGWLLLRWWREGPEKATAAPLRPTLTTTTTTPPGPADVAVFACFFLGAAICLAASATFHTVANHSLRVAKAGNRVDYVGIVALIWGSFVPSVYYGFTGEEGRRLRRVYWGMITTIAAATFFVVLSPRFRSPAWRPFRAALFVAMGLSAVFPVLHGWRVYGLARLEAQMGLSWLVLQGALYIAGAGIYAARVPERWRPRTFDVWGSSHQIFHVLVLLAAGAHLVGLLRAFEHAHRVEGEKGW